MSYLKRNAISTKETFSSKEKLRTTFNINDRDGSLYPDVIRGTVEILTIERRFLEEDRISFSGRSYTLILSKELQIALEGMKGGKGTKVNVAISFQERITGNYAIVRAFDIEKDMRYKERLNKRREGNKNEYR